MKILVAGATGRVATLLIRELIERGHMVYAGARSPEKIAVEHERAIPVALDLHDDAKGLEKLTQGMDAVYFTAGSRGKDLLQTDAFGAVKLMQAAQTSGVGRFIMLSSAFSDRPEKWSDPSLAKIMNYNIAKFFADMWLMNQTELNYTIVQPGNLMEEEATGLIQTGLEQSRPNSLGNVAKVLAAVLEEESTFKKIFTMADGDLPIEEALAQL